LPVPTTPILNALEIIYTGMIPAGISKILNIALADAITIPASITTITITTITEIALIMPTNFAWAVAFIGIQDATSSRICIMHAQQDKFATILGNMANAQCRISNQRQPRILHT